MRVGILSFAHLHAEGYQSILKQMPGVELVGFSHSIPEEAQAYSERFGLRAFSSDQSLLAEGLDGVIVCSENAHHLESVQQAAQAKCHILCEKPIETNEPDAQAMRVACEKNQVHFMTAFPMRFAPSTQAVRQTIQAGQLGSIFGINGINHSEIPKAHRAWFADKGLAGGGAVMDHVVHLADLLRWYFEAEISEVYAEIDNLFYPSEVSVDTAGLLLLKLSNGIQASIDCSWSRPIWYPRWGHLKMEIVGDQGTAVMDSFAQSISVFARGAPRNPTWIGWGPDANRSMLEEWVSSIREKRAPSVGWNDGYQALRVALAAYQSASSQTPVIL